MDDYRYGIGGANNPESRDMTRETLDELAAIEHAAAIARTGTGAGFAPAGTTETTDDEEGRCAECGRPSYWNSGAGQFLCDRHWDEY